MQFELTETYGTSIESIFGAGGFLFINEANFSKISNLVLFDSYSSSSGAQIYTQKAGLKLDLSNSFFQQFQRQAINSYPNQENFYNQGGITLINTASVSIVNCFFVGNQQSQNGGAINILGGTLYVYRSYFQRMQSNQGGVMYLENLQEVKLNFLDISTSIASDNGGGIYIKNPKGDVQIVDSSFNMILAKNEGGCIFYIVEEEPLKQEFNNVGFNMNPEKVPAFQPLRLDFINVKFSMIQAFNASSVSVSSLKTNVNFSQCQLANSYGQSYNSIYIKRANLVEMTNFYVASIYSRSISGFLYVDYVKDSVTVRFSQIYCRTPEDEYTNPPTLDFRTLSENENDIQQRLESEPNNNFKRSLYFDFQSIGQNFYSNRDIMTPFHIKRAGQFFIQGLVMKNCIMQRLHTPRTQALIIFQIQDFLINYAAQVNFVDINSYYEDCEGLSGGIYSFYKIKAYLYNNTVIRLVTNGYAAVHSQYTINLFVQNCTFKNVTQVGGLEGGIFSLLGTGSDLIGARTVTIRNSTFENITMVVGTGGFIYQYDRLLSQIKIESVTVRNVRAGYQGVIYMIGLQGSLHIISLPEFQRTEFSNFFSITHSQFLYIYDGFNRVSNEVKIKDTTIDCLNQDIQQYIPTTYISENEGIIHYEGPSGLYTENCIFRNCRQSYQGPIVKIGNCKYQDKGSQFYNLTGKHIQLNIHQYRYVWLNSFMSRVQFDNAKFNYS
ncbi:UNKNOWN [Stylonychia lemnae]|uniref:Pectin lyase fold/virulence factor n=1 Tax=Stylonychia lemnae TaxID=5949 RepID=A0A078B082_STYLE|nr:UNKNOWN [Stylonychia lemnae]|eukprot:CDW87731.1 UNKNOWN [Stylonychia lemnae]